MSTADEMRKHGRVIVHLPELDRGVEFRTYHVREMLESGLGAMIKQYKEDAEDAEDQGNRILEKCRLVLIACTVIKPIMLDTSPVIVGHETDEPGLLSIHDIPDTDVKYAFSLIVKADDSRFYGVDRTMLDPEKYDYIIDAQMKICYEIDGICQRYGLSPLEVERWNDTEMARVLAMIEGAVAWREAHPPDKAKK